MEAIYSRISDQVTAMNREILASQTTSVRFLISTRALPDIPRQASGSTARTAKVLDAMSIRRFTGGVFLKAKESALSVIESHSAGRIRTRGKHR